MAQEQTLKQYSNFSKGLMTEATPLNFPDDYSLAEENMLLSIDGKRERRDGIEFETGYALTTTTTTDDSVGMSFYRWEFADDREDNTIGVVQVGQDLYFMDLESTVPSANLLNGGNAQSLGGIMATSTKRPLLSFAAVHGVLLVTSEDFLVPARIEYDTNTDTISMFSQKVLVRDLWGIDDGLAVDERPNANTLAHEYNLLNQGWIADNIATYGSTPPFPSNADIMHLGKNDVGAWSEATLNLNFFGNTPAPKGRFIINFFERGGGGATLPDSTNTRTVRASDAGAIEAGTYPQDLETGMFSAVASNFGRVFWAGSESIVTDGDDNSPNASSMILYTQIIERIDQLGNCFTEADPTAEINFEQVDSDGGFIQIPELGKVVKMVPLDNQIIVLAQNGVWSIVSVDGLFTPTSYQVNKVTNVGCIGPDSVIEVEGAIAYWSESGIYQIQQEASGKATASDVTVGTIKTFYNNITKAAKENAKGYYDSITKQVGWVYQSDPSWDFTNYPDFCDKELVYDLQLQAFSPNTISSKAVQSPYITGVVLGENLNTNTTVDEVQVGGSPVLAGGVTVEVTTTNTVQTTSKLKYLTYVPSSGFAAFTLSQYSNEDFYDWDTENYTSFIETGYIGFEDWARNKQILYLICHFERTETGFDANFNALNESSCFVRVKWQWSDAIDSKRWGRSFQAYRYRRPYFPEDVNDRFETGFRLITTRNKIRGKGQALNLRFESEEGKDLILHGFALSARGQTSV